ncbi:MAG: hypothetical protein QOJ09_2332, partial [Actinomycetota bacterium]|nr:hypothetical protein [Actinomycetota bacterium]
MIFTSLGLLLVALGFLIGGIAKSSVALLMVSLFVTLFAGVTLVLVATAARRIVAAQQQTPTIDLRSEPVPPLESATNGAGAPVVGYDEMTAEQVVRLIRSGALSGDQLDVL